jgi:hypothetical protein
MLDRKVVTCVVAPAFWPFKIASIVERNDMVLSAPVKPLQITERANLSTAICGMRQNRADTRNLHLVGDSFTSRKGRAVVLRPSVVIS